MIISLIVAAAENNAIGGNNDLLWHLPNDMKFFKNTTWGFPVIMGRKSYDALKGNPLPGRFNIVITRQENWNPGNDSVAVVKTLEAAIELATTRGTKEIFIIGGGQIYEQSMSIANRIYLTRVHTSLEGDAFFPEVNPDQWRLISRQDFPADEKHAFAYSFEVWEP
jgi:dihydrofolate reductase